MAMDCGIFHVSEKESSEKEWVKLKIVSDPKEKYIKKYWQRVTGVNRKEEIIGRISSVHNAFT